MSEQRLDTLEKLVIPQIHKDLEAMKSLPARVTVVEQNVVLIRDEIKQIHQQNKERREETNQKFDKLFEKHDVLQETQADLIKHAERLQGFVIGGGFVVGLIFTIITFFRDPIMNWLFG